MYTKQIVMNFTTVLMILTGRNLSGFHDSLFNFVGNFYIVIASLALLRWGSKAISYVIPHLMRDLCLPSPWSPGGNK